MILRSETTSPDHWVVLATGATVLALPAADAARFDGLGDRLAAADGFRAALEALVGQGISAAPSFAIVDATAPGAVRVVLRGDAEAVTASGSFDGRGVTTWTERVLEGGGSLRLSVPGSTWTLTPGAAEPSPVPAVAVPAVVVPAPPAAPPAEAVPPTEETAVEVTTLAPPRHEDMPEQHEEAAPEPYDFLFGDTIYRTAQGGSVRIPNPDPERPGDHDGSTVLAEGLGLAGHEAQLPAAVAVTPLTVSLELPGGQREPITRPILIGRSPSAGAGRITGAELPTLLTVAPDDKDISRTHARVEVQGGAVVVTDLDSKNGTLVTLPGATARKLRGGEPAVVLPGTVIDLGGGVTLTVRED